MENTNKKKTHPQQQLQQNEREPKENSTKNKGGATKRKYDVSVWHSQRAARLESRSHSHQAKKENNRKANEMMLLRTNNRIMPYLPSSYAHDQPHGAQVRGRCRCSRCRPTQTSSAHAMTKAATVQRCRFIGPDAYTWANIWEGTLARAAQEV